MILTDTVNKKSPMSEIAKEAGISKSLLFHYFKNKKEFYLYLYSNVFTLMREIAADETAVTETDFFEIFLQSSKFKCKLLKLHVYSFRFMMNTFYEDDEEVARDLIGKNSDATNNSIIALLGIIDKNKFKDELDIAQLINIIGWCVEGFWKEKFRSPHLNMDEIDSGYEKIIDFFRKSTYKEEYLK
ncbi:TetR/AcrR family transcriptional regulator [Clostridium estertheticum]|uniref:TetR/AcrR family transcriptional regulator n=1 Tax=Clostridium estertheticum TaxID=238834 RepID=UPI0013E99D49|nr:TetR/AcrR family transcriptional regulator [Clostridium estertheticum]MBZ9686922.1 TetR/AcrR family transcriptional regulator [Clostridium estertheticum]